MLFTYELFKSLSNVPAPVDVKTQLSPGEEVEGRESEFQLAAVPKFPLVSPSHVFVDWEKIGSPKRINGHINLVRYLNRMGFIMKLN